MYIVIIIYILSQIIKGITMKKEKYTVEYEMGSVSPSVLWTYLSTSQGLENWFADKVNNTGKKFIFEWNKSEQIAEQVGIRMGSFVKFRWADEEDKKVFFEFKIQQVELTGSTILEITDFAEPEEKQEIGRAHV